MMKTMNDMIRNKNMILLISILHSGNFESPPLFSRQNALDQNTSPFSYKLSLSIRFINRAHYILLGKPEVQKKAPKMGPERCYSTTG
jgi:hypothetical protein